MKTKIVTMLAAALLIAACSGGNNENGKTDGDMAVANNDTGGTTDTGTTPTDTGTTPTDTGTTPTDTGTPPADMGTPPADMATADTGTPDTGAPDMAEPRSEAHGCTYASATDMTGNATVNLTDLGAWVVGHKVCVIVDAGTIVTWDGNFTQHPLDGGVSPTADAANPIDIAGTGLSGNTSVDVTFDTAGDYPYYCGIHTTSMQGLVYVD